jgi:phospholipid/cholesterol/gamma-HCH transport system substrate-binding protein
MSGEHRYEVQAGIFLLVTLGMFVLSIYFLGRDRQLFETQVEYLAEFPDIKGLNEGAPVRLGGIAIGRVAGIAFAGEGTESRIQVRVLVNDGYVPRLRADAEASIDTQGLLGDRFISINGGVSPNPLLPGAVLKAKAASDIGQALARAGSLVDSAADVAERLSNLASKLDGQPIDDFSAVLASTASLLKEVESGQGLLHRLVYSKQDGDSLLGNIDKAAKDLSEIVGELKQGDGLLHALVYGEQGAETVSALGDAARGLATASQEISQVASQIRNGKGLVNQLLYAESPEGVDDIVASLSRTAQNLENVSRSLSEGSGTLGALLIDSKLYDNVVEITDDAKRSYILRRAIRQSLEAGASPEDKKEFADVATAN